MTGQSEDGGIYIRHHKMIKSKGQIGRQGEAEWRSGQVRVVYDDDRSNGSNEDEPDGAETKATLPSGARSIKWPCCSLGASRSDANTMRTV